MNLSNFRIKNYVSVFMLFIFTQAISAQEFCPPGQTIEYSNSANDIVIEYHVDNTILANQDPTPVMRIYGNGLVKVHYPIYMTKAGDYEYQLTAQELQELLNSLDSNCIFSFKQKAVKEKVKQIKAQQEVIAGQRILSYRSDPSITHINVNLKNYTNSNGKVLENNASSTTDGIIHVKTSWPDIEYNAPKYPAVVELQGFATANNVLKNISKNSKLQKVP